MRSRENLHWIVPEAFAVCEKFAKGGYKNKKDTAEVYEDQVNAHNYLMVIVFSSFNSRGYN